MIDHHDISGFENPWATLETACGRETRPQLLINILNRLRTLDYSRESRTDKDANEVCHRCKIQKKASKEEALEEDGPASGANSSNADVVEEFFD